MSTQPDPVSYFDDTLAAFEAAFARTPVPFEQYYCLAERTVRIRIAGAELATRFAPAFEHARATPTATPDLSIACWDRAATGTEPPPPIWPNDDYLARGLIRGFVGQRIRAAYGVSERMLSLYDRERGEAVVHVAAAEKVGRWADRAPFRTVIGWCADDQGLVFLHASAVALGGHGLAIAGPSGSGKSTTALSCVVAGWRLMGDDICLIRLTDGGPSHATMFPVFAFAKVELDALERLPGLWPAIRDNGEQLIVDAAPSPRDCADLRAVLLPSVVARAKSEVAPISRAAALRTLVPGSVLEGIGAGPSALPMLVQLLAHVECWSIELGSDPDDVVAALTALAGTSS